MAGRVVAEGADWHAHLRSLPSDVDRELAQLDRRFGEGFSLVEKPRVDAAEGGGDDAAAAAGGGDGPPGARCERVLSLRWVPSDPDFCFELEEEDGGCTLKVVLPVGYPAAGSTAQLELATLAVDEGLRKAVEKVWNKQCTRFSGKTHVRTALKWLDNNITQLLMMLLQLREEKRAANAAAEAAASGGPAPSPRGSPRAGGAVEGGDGGGGGSNEDASALPSEEVPNDMAHQDSFEAVDDGEEEENQPLPDWTVRQHLQLESALRRDTPIRADMRYWENVSSKVDGMSASACLARYIELQALVSVHVSSGQLERSISESSSRPPIPVAAAHAIVATSDVDAVVAEEPTLARQGSGGAGGHPKSATEATSSLVAVAQTGMGRGRGRGRGRGTAAAPVGGSIGALTSGFSQARGRGRGRGTRIESGAVAGVGVGGTRAATPPEPPSAKDSATGKEAAAGDGRDVGEVKEEEGAGSVVAESAVHDDAAEGDAARQVSARPFAKISLNPERRGTQVVLDSVSLHNVGVIWAQVMRVLCQCDRCQYYFEVNLDNTSKPRHVAGEAGDADGAGAGSETSESDVVQKYNQWCPQCSIRHEVSYRPEMAHERNPSLGYIDCANSAVADMLPTLLASSCLECSTTWHTEKFQCGLASPTEATCRSCFAKMRVVCKAFQIVVHSGPAAEAVGDGSKAKKKKRGKGHGPQLIPDTPLPARGTCEHYKRSYRWLRFPCCARLFPCDQCHDKKMDHEHTWASRMVCGICSREQPFSQDSCQHCGMNVSSSSSGGRYWEGGKGVRDRSKLAKGDSRKFKGAAKTSSRKSSRVGPKTKRRG